MSLLIEHSREKPTRPLPARDCDGSRLGRFLAQVSPMQYLLIIVASIAFLTFANLSYSALQFELGHPYKSILYGPDDRFADLIKISLSYKTFLQGLADTKGFQTWPEQFKNYYLQNPYGGIDALAQGNLSHFHAPPLSALFCIGCAALIAHTQSVWLLLALVTLLYLGIVYWAIAVCLPPEARIRVTAAYLFVLSYPALFVFTRGHFIDGIASVLIDVFVVRLFVRGRADLIALASFAVVLNIRPDAIVYLLAIPLVLGIRASVKPVLIYGGLSFGILTASYLATHALYPDYTVSTFFHGLSNYNKSYVAEGSGDAFNSSLTAFVKSVNRMGDGAIHQWSLILLILLGAVLALALVGWGFRRPSRWILAGPLLVILSYWMLVVGWMYHQYPYKASLAFSVVLIGAVCCGLFKEREPAVTVPFLLTALFCLVKPVFGDYNLLVFAAPVLVLSVSPGKWSGRTKSVCAVTLGSIVMLAPKNYYFNGGASIQLLLNPFILYALALYVASNIFTETSPAVAEKQHPGIVAESAAL